MSTASLTYLRDQLGEWGWRAVPKLTSEMIHKLPNREGQSIWDAEWDLLVVLDSCRVDWMRSVADDYAFVEDVETIWSVGGHSEEWLEETFANVSGDSLADVTYVSGNPFTDAVPTDRFDVFEDVLSLDYGDEFSSPPAHVLTDRAVALGRQSDAERMIVHYMQPHRPFFERDGDRRDVDVLDWSVGLNIYHEHFDGDLERTDLFDGYVANLRYVLEEVSVLLENVDAPRVVITSDHGHALGERFLWDHRQGVQHPVMREVPWVETEATDEGTLDPPDYGATEETQADVEERLEALGYR